MKIVNWVRREGRKYEQELTNDAIGHLIWAHTGYPDFWHTDNPGEEFKGQIRRSLADGKCTIDNCGDLAFAALGEDT